MKEPLIQMMRVSDEKYKGDFVIDCSYVEIEDGQSIVDAEPVHDVSMRITGPALYGLMRSIESRTDPVGLEASQYKRGLIPCRYCGRQTELAIVEDGAYFIRCPCGAKGRYADSVDGAVAEWNRRM